MMKRENKLIVAAVLLPLLVGAFFDQMSTYKLSSMHFFVLTALIVTYNGVLFLQRADWERRKAVLRCSGMGFFTIGVIQGICLIRDTENVSDNLKTCLGISLAVILTAAFLILLKEEKGVTEDVIMLAIFAAFMVRILYAVLTSSGLYQNDLTIFHPDCQGHLGYVYQLYTNGKLPDIDPTTAYEFYQPPLHYAVSAVFLKALRLLGLLPSDRRALEETLQVLPMIYSSLTIVFIYKITKQMRLSLEARLTAVCFAGFLPYSVMLGAALNNDPLAILLMIMCIYYTFKWYEKPDMKGILIMALCIGGAMMTKISAGLIAPAMAIMMLHRAWRDRKQWTIYLRQFGCFGLIAFPMGLWHSIYNFIRYRMPIGYISDLAEDSEQFIGMHDKWSRFFDFNQALDFLFVRFDYVNDFADYNIPVALIKFATFGEGRYYQATRLTYAVGTGLFWTNAVLFVLMAAALVVWCFFRDGRMVQKIFMMTAAGVIIYFYLKACIRYTHVCTMNIRYIMCAVYVGCIVIAAAASGLQERIAGKSEIGGRICKVALISIPVLYAVAVIVLKVGMETVIN